MAEDNKNKEIDKYKMMELYTKSNYRVLGNNKHSAIKPCHWQEQKLLTGRENRNCYKGYFGIESHLCIQNTPALPFCTHQCVFCWRDIEDASFGPNWLGDIDSPKSLVKQMIKHSRNLIKEHISLEKSLKNLEIMHRILNHMVYSLKEQDNYQYTVHEKKLAKKIGLSVRKTNRALLLLKNMDILQNPQDFIYTLHPKHQSEIENEEDVKKIIAKEVTTESEIRKVFEEAMNPKHAAISLAGEPTLYPKIGELVMEFRKRKFSTFIVTNGTRPDIIKKLKNTQQLPTQLYVTVPAPNRQTYLKVCRPLIKDGWEKLKETISLLPDLPCRTVVRITAVKYLNMDLDLVEEYAELFTSHPPDFIDIKGFTVEANALRMTDRWPGNRELREYRPTYEDILEFAKSLAKKTGFEIVAESERSVDILIRAAWPKNKSLEIDYSNV